MLGRGGAGDGSRALRPAFSGRTAKTPSSAIILRVLIAVMLACSFLSLGVFVLSKYTRTVADDPVEVVEDMLLKRSTPLPADPFEAGREQHADNLSGPLGELFPDPEVLVDPRDREKRSMSSLGTDPGFPPTGIKLGVFTAKLFFENQRRYEDVTLELIRRQDAVFLAGAGMCEVVQSRYVLLKPCIFRDEIVERLSSGVRGPYEFEILRSLSFFVSLPFEGYTRHITSTLGCEGLAEYRMTVQFLRRLREGYVSLRIPYSVSEVDAVEDLQANADSPCRGEDIFFEPEQLMKMLALIDMQRSAREHDGGS
jgi:hypothetical protein